MTTAGSNTGLPLPAAPPPRPRSTPPATDNQNTSSEASQIVMRRQGGGSFWKVLFQILVFIVFPVTLIIGVLHGLPTYVMNVVGGLLVYVGGVALGFMGGEPYFQSQLGSLMLLVLFAGVVLGFMFSRGRRQQ